jgi:hypothetical protein
VGREVVHDHHLPGAQARGERLLDVEASKTALVVAPATATDGPMPSMLMLESSVTFFPQFSEP